MGAELTLLAADAAGEQLLSSVHPFMGHQEVVVGKCRITLRAAQGLATSACSAPEEPRALTHALVDLELRLSPESFVADAAREWFHLRVPRHVRRKCSFVSKAFTTEGAAERFLSGVDFQVIVQTCFLSEPFTTQGAAEGFHSHVSPHVYVQIPSPFKCFGAHRAAEGFSYRILPVFVRLRFKV